MRESPVRRRVGGSYHPEPSELRLSRRQVLVAGGTGLAATALAACAGQTAPLLRPVDPEGPEVEAAERARLVAGATTASFTVNPGRGQRRCRSGLDPYRRRRHAGRCLPRAPVRPARRSTIEAVTNVAD